MDQAEEMARLSEEIDKRAALVGARPKRKYVTSSIKQPEYQSYLETWTKTVELVGNKHYPEEARRLKLSGRVILTVSIGRNGQLLEVAIDKSSGIEILDNAAIEITKLASPFLPIPTIDDVDILYITRTWDFNNGPVAGSSPAR